MFAKKICPKNDKLYVFEKPLTIPLQICKNFCKILINLIFNQEKLKMCKFAKIEFFIAKSSYKVNMFAKKKFVQKMKNYTFLKSP